MKRRALLMTSTASAACAVLLLPFGVMAALGVSAVGSIRLPSPDVFVCIELLCASISVLATIALVLIADEAA